MKARRLREYFCLFVWAPEDQGVRIPGVGFSFKPKGLASVTPLLPSDGMNGLKHETSSDS